jgi:hypothetical protein
VCEAVKHAPFGWKISHIPPIKLALPSSLKQLLRFDRPSQHKDSQAGLPTAFWRYNRRIAASWREECLLVISGKSGVESGPNDPLAKNPSENGLLKPLILLGSVARPTHGHKL